jgi:multiple sugar transport system permease protein
MGKILSSFRSNSFRRGAAPYVFVSPFYIFFFVFGAFPILYALYLSFHQWNGLSTAPMVWVGLGNYIDNIQDPLFWQALGNTVYLAILSSLPQHILGLFFAFVLNLGFVKLKDFFKASFFLPYITAGVSIAIIFGIFFGYQYGILNYFLISIGKWPVFKEIFNWLGINGILPWKWLGQITTIIPSISALIIWEWTGWNSILYLAALQAIPHELYEAARVDGAKWHQVFFKITLPSIKPMMQFAVSMSIIGGMQLFSEPYILVGKDGGVGHAGFTVAMNIYQTAFEFNQFGFSSAVCYMLFLIIFILYMINNRLFRTDEGVV